ARTGNQLPGCANRAEAGIHGSRLSRRAALGRDDTRRISRQNRIQRTGDPGMNRAALTEKILDIKRQNGWSWKHICQEIGGYSPGLLGGAAAGQMDVAKPAAANGG